MTSSLPVIISEKRLFANEPSVGSHSTCRNINCLSDFFYHFLSLTFMGPQHCEVFVFGSVYYAYEIEFVKIQKNSIFSASFKSRIN